MTRHTFTQIGTFSIAIMVPLFIFSLIMLFIPDLKDSGGSLVMVFVSLILFVCLLIFYKITITVDESTLSFTLGAGLIKKTYPIDEIKSCRPVRNFPLTGFGIRKIPNGWLYNVSGLGAIELAFKNKNSVIRIGTDKPELVSQTINAFIKQHIHGGETFENRSTGKFSSMAIFVVVMAGVVILLMTGNRETRIKTTGKDFTISGIYGMTLDYSDIISLDTLSVLPGIKLRTNGFASGKILKGNFLLEDKRRVKLFITKGKPPYIHFKTMNGEFYLNLKDRNKTKDLYKQLERGVAELTK
jgi:hypothetical protein